MKLDPKTLRAIGCELRKRGRVLRAIHGYSYGLGYIDAGDHCSQQARAIEKRAKKQRGRR